MEKTAQQEAQVAKDQAEKYGGAAAAPIPSPAPSGAQVTLTLALTLKPHSSPYYS